MKYLGQTMTFQQATAEIKNRIRAWASFYRYKQELTSKSYFLHHRLRLFNMVVTPTLSYASGTWTLSREHERTIRSTQRKMLRLIVQTKRKYKKRKLRPARMRKTKKVKKKTTEAQMMKLQRVAVQTQIATKAVTSPS